MYNPSLEEQFAFPVREKEKRRRREREEKKTGR